MFTPYEPIRGVLQKLQHAKEGHMSDVQATISADAQKAIDSIASAKRVVADAQSIVKHPNTWVANLTSAATAVVAIIVIFHPGFKEPAAVQAAIGSASVIAAAASQVVHFATRRQAQTALAVAKITK